MFKKYLTLTLRNIKKNKTYSLINILGLAVGMVVCVLVILYVQMELSYDKFNKDYDKIYRVKINFADPFWKGIYEDGGILTPAMLKDYITQNCPEAIEATRVGTKSFNKKIIKHKDFLEYENNYLSVDPSFFDVFDFKFINGSKYGALKDINSMVVTEKFAKKYFGSENPVNKTINAGEKDYIITAVLKDCPANSHLKFDYLLPIVVSPGEKTSWSALNYATYVKLKDPQMAAELIAKISGLPKTYGTDDLKNDKLYLQPLKDIHLYSHTDDEFEAGGSVNTVYGLITLALLVLTLACINFMNLSTAKSYSRSVEIGLRKVIGAERKHLIKQFMLESVFLSFISLLTAVIIINLIIPLFNQLVGAEISFELLGNISVIIIIILFTLVIGIFAGSYPAFYLSSFRPITIMRKNIHYSGGGVSFRKAMIVFQFVVCSSLILGTIIITKQIFFLNNKELGYKKEQIMILPVDRKLRNEYNTFKGELLNYPVVKSASLSTFLPNDIQMNVDLFWDNPNKILKYYCLSSDSNFFRVYDVKLVKGEVLSQAKPGGTEGKLLLNETAARYMNLENPIGTKMGQGKEFFGEVTGVVKDFHFKSLHENIAPLLISIGDDNISKYLSIRIETKEMANAINTIKTKFNEMFPNRPFNYSFFDEQFDKMYKKENQFAGVISSFSFLSIFVACLGLLGMVTFTIEKRKKEIGIRKVLGAEAKNIVSLISKEFILLIVVANIIAIPIAYYTMNKWLADFAYKTEMNWWIFILSISVGVVISVITIGFQTIKAAISNPVDSLKNE